MGARSSRQQAQKGNEYERVPNLGEQKPYLVGSVKYIIAKKTSPVDRLGSKRRKIYIELLYSKKSAISPFLALIPPK